MLETVQEKQSCPDAPTLSLAYLAYSTLGPVQLGTDLPALPAPAAHQIDR